MSGMTESKQSGVGRWGRWIPDRVGDDMIKALCHSFERGNPVLINGGKMNNYYVYILASRRNGTLYIGVSNNLERRMYEHQYGLVPGFTEKYEVTKLVYFEHTELVESAIAREKQLKRWNRQWKIELIEKHNPEWKDLSEDWLIRE